MATTARKSAKRTSNKQFDDAQLTKFYEDMLLIRRFEEKAGQLYGMGLIGGFCHLYIGQEAVVVGISMSLETGKDSVITGYRDHGHMLADGMDPDGVMAELTGREAAIPRGRAARCTCSPPKSTSSAATASLRRKCRWARVLAFAHKYNEMAEFQPYYSVTAPPTRGRLTKHATWPRSGSCQIVFVMRKQPLRDGHIQRARRCDHRLCGTRQALGIPGARVDGMDVEAMATEAAKGGQARAALAKARMCLEAMTYRYRGHSMSDPPKYRTKEEVQKNRPSKIRSERLREDCLRAACID